VYPNPFVSDVYIRNVTLTPLDIRLTDAAGRILGRYTSSVSNIDINMSKYPSGVYFISVENKLNNKSITKKVIKK
jgi:FlaG/FlaF family flagellin (archaellin)